MHSRVTATLFALLLAGLNAPLQADVLRVGVENDSPPKWLASPVPTAPSGFCAELLGLVAKAHPDLSFTYSSEALPQKRIETGVQTGALDLICGLTRTPEREARFHFIDKPIYLMDYVLFAQAGDPVAVQSWTDVRALAHNGLILLNYDSSAIGRLQKLGGLQLDASGRTVEQNLKKLSSGRGRFFYYTRQGGVAAIQQLDLQNEVRVIEPAMDSQPFYLLTGKHVSSTRRQSLFDTLETLEQGGELNKLRNKWGLR